MSSVLTAGCSDGGADFAAARIIRAGCFNLPVDVGPIGLAGPGSSSNVGGVKKPALALGVTSPSRRQLQSERSVDHVAPAAG
jgi:hypothetical protein